MTTQAMYTIKDFHSIWPWEYKGDGLYDLDIGINQGTDAANTTLSDGLIVIAVGDIDDNKHNDIISMSDDQMNVTINYFSTDSDKFGNQKVLPTGSCRTSAAYVITNLDYRIALLCTENIEFEYVVLFKNDKEFTNVVLSDFKLEKGSQPFFMDINSDTYVDMVFNDNSFTGNYPIRVALYNTETRDFESTTLGLFDTYLYENTTQGCLAVINKSTLRLSKPNFSTLADMNADCVSDLYMTVDTGAGDLTGLSMIATRIETATQGYMRYCSIESDNLAALEYTSPVFADFNNDAAIDKIFYKTDTNAIHIFYNSIGANGPSSSNLCRSMPTLKYNEENNYFQSLTIYGGEPDITAIENVSGLYANPLVAAFIPGQLRVADLDSNGYPDIVTTFKDADGDPVSAVLINSECGSDVSYDVKRSLTSQATTQQCYDRTFDTSNDYSRVSEYGDTMYIFLLDYDDNGRMDFGMVAIGDNNTTVLLAFYNNYAKDSYYVTAITYTQSGSAYGSKVYGVNYRGVYTTLQDSNKVFTAHQLSRTAFGALESPVAFYAIGRSNNYIEDFTLTYPIQKYTNEGNQDSLSVQSKVWTPIIPNSHLMIDIHEKTDSNWSIQLLINPTDSFLLVGIILTFILLIIAGILIYIHVKEKKEDEESRNPQLDFF